MAVGAFQSDTFDLFTFQGEYTAVLDTTEAKDDVDITVGIVGTASLSVTEADDTAAFTSISTTDVSFTLTEAKDTASFSSDATTYASLDTTEAKDVASFIAFTTFLTFNITEPSDSYSGRVFHAFFTEGDADIVLVHSENKLVVLPPAGNTCTIQGGQFARTWHVQSELRQVEIDQTRALRREDT